MNFFQLFGKIFFAANLNFFIFQFISELALIEARRIYRQSPLDPIWGSLTPDEKVKKEANNQKCFQIKKIKFFSNFFKTFSSFFEMFSNFFKMFSSFFKFEIEKRSKICLIGNFLPEFSNFFFYEIFDVSFFLSASASA